MLHVHARRPAAFVVCIPLVLAAATCLPLGAQSGPPYRIDAASIQRGKELFDRHCAACHNFDTAEIGPTLRGTTATVDKKWLAAFIREAPQMIERGDARAVQLYKQYKQLVMPPFPALSADDVEQLLAYMHTFPAAAKPADVRGGELTDPIPAKIHQSGLTLVLEKVLTIPPSDKQPPLTRINKMLAVGSGAGERLFMHDLRGKLFEIRNNTPSVYLDVTTVLPRFIPEPGLGTGFGSFDFHPEFATNGLFYTTHTEPAKSAPADFAIGGGAPVRLQWVLLEWKANDPRAGAFSGSHRELLRADMYSQIHGFQELTFNPLAKRGDADYGLLYLASGDGGAGVTKYWTACCANGVWGTVLRIDPAGRNSRNGNYGIPADNPFVRSGGVPAEVWARGFRNAHRITWDVSGSRTMFITDIGQSAIEEVNLGAAGAHYGWPKREGMFLLDVPANPKTVYARPPKDDVAYTYAAAEYDHDEGNAISGGFVYAGDRIPLLRGKYVFGDITRGRIFFAEVAAMQPGRQATIREFALQAGGTRTDLHTLTRDKRVDLRFGQDSRGDLYVFTKADGAVWKVVDCVFDRVK